MSQEQAKQFIDQATQSLQSGQFQQALELLDQAAALAPSDSEVQVLRGICLSQTGQPNEATEAFRKAIMLSPYNAKAYYNMAVHQYALGSKVEALEMAREAVKIDGRHAAARQLMTSIEGELHTPVSPIGNKPANPNDPLSTPAAPPPPTDSTPMPPGVGGPLQSQPQADAQILQPEAPRVPPAQAPPAGSPYGAPQPGAPGVPPPGYYRQGYQSSSVHSISWIEGMGGAWTGIGWAIAVLNLLIVIATFVVVFQYMGSNAGAASSSTNPFQANQIPGMAPYQVGALITLVGGILYMVLDLVDRRGNFLWLIPQVICGCCGGTWLVLPIYMLAGRK